MAEAEHQEGRHRPGDRRPARSKGGYRGETGKVIAVYPETQRVLVEGVNRVKKHTKVGTSGRGSKTGGIITQEAPIHVSNVHAGGPGDEERRPGSASRVETVRARTATHQATSQRPRRQARPARTSDMTATDEPDPRRSPPRLKTRYRERDRARRCAPSSSYANVMQVPGLVKIVVNMGVGEAARDSKLIEGADPRPRRDHRPEAAGHQGPQVHRAVQAARGHADRRARHAARRPDVGVPRPAAVGGAAAHPRLPRPLAASSSTAAATTPSV